MKILLNWLFINLFMVCTVAAEDEGEKEGARALMEKHIFPLLQEADHVEILSVYPYPKRQMKDEPDRRELSTAFHIKEELANPKLNDVQKKVLALSRKAPLVEGYPVLGKVTISKQEEVKSLLTIIRSNMLASDESDKDGELEEAECHFPRHALRITKGEQVIYFSICYECNNTYMIGAPKTAATRTRGFRHFKKELREILEKYFEAEGVIYAPYTQKKDESTK